ncbi:MAG: DUF2610 domain-containing protein [Rickettsiales bacterium]
MASFTFPAVLLQNNKKSNGRIRMYCGEPNYYKSPIYYQRLWTHNFTKTYIPDKIVIDLHKLLNCSYKLNKSYEQLLIHALINKTDQKKAIKSKIDEISKETIVDLEQIRKLSKEIDTVEKSDSPEIKQIIEKPQTESKYSHFGISFSIRQEMLFIDNLCINIFNGKNLYSAQFYLISSLLILISRIKSSETKTGVEQYCDNLGEYLCYNTEKRFREITYRIACALDVYGYCLPINVVSYFNFFLILDKITMHKIITLSIAQLNEWVYRKYDKPAKYATDLLTKEMYKDIKDNVKNILEK